MSGQQVSPSMDLPKYQSGQKCCFNPHLEEGKPQMHHGFVYLYVTGHLQATYECQTSDDCLLSVQADFMKMPFADNTFDAIYAIEATCHAPDAVGCYKEIYRVLKPGQCFAAYEWCMTDSFDANNQNHQKVKAEIELGNGLPDIRTTAQCLEALKLAGFDVIWEKDLAEDSPVSWYLPLDTSRFSITSFRLTSFGRLITRTLVKTLEYVGLAPEGSNRVSSFLERAAEGLVEGGRKGLFTPMYFFLVQKPKQESYE